jgi:DNA-binding transcriptional LysR family regulator
MVAPFNLNRFDLISLRLFIETVEGGSLTEGADRFGISLAAASKRIAELEAHVGSALLVRSKRGVAPTAAGETLRRHAIDLVAGLEQLALAMDDYQRGAGGHLRLWANPSAFATFLPTMLAAFSAEHPAVMIDLEEVLSEDAARAVTRGAAELAVVGDNTPVEGLQTMVCEVDELVLLMPRVHPLAGEPTVPIEEVLACDIVGMNRSTSLMRQLAAGAARSGRSLKIRVRVRSFDAMCRMVAAGIGVAILPQAAAAPLVKAMGLRTARLSGMRTQRCLLLAMRDREALSPASQAFVNLVENRINRASERSGSASVLAGRR